MYLEGIITIDPSDLTNVVKVKPTKGFAKIAHALTGGLVSSKEERELFYAISILQQVNIVFRSLGVDNVVSITKDDVVVYEDLHGKEGDFKEALDGFLATARTGNPDVFNSLRMVLEHHRGEMTYLIDIGIMRNHPVGEHPIRITINGLSQQLNAGQGEEQVRSTMQSVFASQDNYDAFVQLHKTVMQEFMEAIKAAFHKNMSVDKISTSNRVKIVRPNQHVASRQQIPQHRDQYHADSYYHDPVYDGHHGYDDAFFYAWLWSDHCHDNNIHCHNCAIVDEQGLDVIEIGEEGFDAGDGNTLNVDEPFAVPETGGSTVHEGHAFDEQIKAASADPLESTSDTSDSGGGWFDSLMGDSFGGDGGSSCGGSSCGSSCGGCGGGD